MVLRDWLQANDDRLVKMKATTGMYSYVSANGRSNPDHLICSTSISQTILDFKILDNETAWGSDHRPLSFNLPFIGTNVDQTVIKPRWAVEKLRHKETAEQYRTSLELEAPVFKTISTEKEAQTTIDLNHQHLLLWMERAMRNSCGYIGQSTFINQTFWNDELKALEKDLEFLTIEANKLDGKARRLAWKKVTKTAKKLRMKAEEKRREIYP